MARLILLRDKRQKEYAGILNYIEQVDDSLVRRIILIKYVSKGKVTWRDVSNEIYKRPDKEDYLRIKLDRYLHDH